MEKGFEVKLKGIDFQFYTIAIILLLGGLPTLVKLHSSGKYFVSLVIIVLVVAHTIYKFFKIKNSRYKYNLIKVDEAGNFLLFKKGGARVELIEIFDFETIEKFIIKKEYFEFAGAADDKNAVILVEKDGSEHIIYHEADAKCFRKLISKLVQGYQVVFEDEKLQKQTMDYVITGKLPFFAWLPWWILFPLIIIAAVFLFMVCAIIVCFTIAASF